MKGTVASGQTKPKHYFQKNQNSAQWSKAKWLQDDPLPKTYRDFSLIDIGL